jgi:Zn-dependent M28 family amino/carboxypeptidase
MPRATTNRIRRNLLALLITFALVAAPAFAQNTTTPFVPDAERLRAHIYYLASDKLEGRRTGTPGAEEAARYVAEEFQRLGLAPAGDGLSDLQVRAGRTVSAPFKRYFQLFPYVAGVGLGKGNTMTLTTRAADAAPQAGPETLDLRVGEDWMPLGFSASGSVETTRAVFVGYGITATDRNHDDYKAADVKGNIAVALAGTPDGDNPHGLTSAGEPRFKAAAARAAGARALVIIAREDNFKDDGLATLKYDNEGGDAGLPVVVISRQAAAKSFGIASPSLSELEGARRMAANGVTAADKEKPHDAVVPSSKNTYFSITTDVVRRNAPASNVVGVLEGSDPELKNETIVIGAHYDHLGRGGEGSLAAREGEIHHGADDNASGTAGLLELARLFSQERARMRRTVVFVAFGGEEEGLIGSSYYVAHPARPLAQTVTMINMDMIGRLRQGALSVGGIGTAAEWRGRVEEANRGYNVTLDPSLTGEVTQSAGNARVEDGARGDERRDEKRVGREGGKGDGERAGKSRRNGDEKGDGSPMRVRNTSGGRVPIIVTGSNGRTAVTATPGERFALRLSEDGYGPSDHSSFYARRVPVLFFFTGSHEDYHKPSDTADRINYEGEARVLQFIREIVEGIQSSDRRPTYAVAKAEANSRSTGFRVYLGTVPNYGDATDGLKLDAVREGSPAERAGLKAGDKVVRLAGRDVRNIYDYTQALSEMKAGQEYEAEVLRDGQRLTLKVTPDLRK